MIKLRATLLVLSLFALPGAVACGNSGGLTGPEPTQSPAASGSAAKGGPSSATAPAASPTSSPDRGAVVQPTTEPETPLTAQEKEAVDIMWRMIDRYGAANSGAVVAAGGNGHRGLVPVLVEAAGRTFEPALALEIARALEKITGSSVGGDFVLVGPWYSWMSRQDPPQEELKGFDEWRGELLGSIDPSFRQFIYADVPARVPIWTVQWGGVVRDGIPPLEFPKTIAAVYADFLQPDEPVFGVTINGESRAYPHRILGWHELVNDQLGGELITFVF